LGSEPLLPRSPALYRRLFDGIFEDLPQCQCIFSENIPTESFAWDYLRGEGSRSRRYFSYLWRLEETKWHLIDLREGFDQYLGAMTAKTRRNLRRQVRVLREHGGGRLECRRVEAEDQVEAFLEAAERVRARSWKGRRLTKWISADESALVGPELKGLARAKILRSYLLECGGEPCAFSVNYQFDGVFTGKLTCFDEALGRLSPGTVLLYLLLEDLFARDRPELFNMGHGSAPYKERFGNQTAKQGCLYLFRRNLANRLRHMSLVTFQSGVRLAKRLLKVEHLSNGILRG
jgi:CelD/BcsL family acetyltransferase involved in cellulose biosynthesis